MSTNNKLMNSNNTNNEIWKSIDSTTYEVSNQGRVRSIYKNGNSLILTPSSNGQKENDYQFHIICGKKQYVHQLVLEAFVGKKPKGYECDHKDGNKLNNSIDNLRYLLIAENRSHKGQSHPNSKLNNEQVLLMRSLFDNYKDAGINQKKLAQLFDVNPTTISGVITRRSWNHI